MSREKRQRIDTSGSNDPLGANLFGDFEVPFLLPEGPTLGIPVAQNHEMKTPKTKGGRLDVKREKSGRGGKTVTVIYAFPGMDERMKKEVLLLLKKQLATGGTISSGNIEIQGDFPDQVVDALVKAGYKAIRAGG